MLLNVPPTHHVTTAELQVPIGPFTAPHPGPPSLYPYHISLLFCTLMMEEEDYSETLVFIYSNTQNHKKTTILIFTATRKQTVDHKINTQYYSMCKILAHLNSQ